MTPSLPLKHLPWLPITLAKKKKKKLQVQSSTEGPAPSGSCCLSHLNLQPTTDSTSLMAHLQATGHQEGTIPLTRLPLFFQLKPNVLHILGSQPPALSSPVHPSGWSQGDLTVRSDHVLFLLPHTCHPQAAATQPTSAQSSLKTSLTSMPLPFHVPAVFSAPQKGPRCSLLCLSVSCRLFSKHSSLSPLPRPQLRLQLPSSLITLDWIYTGERPP